MSDLDAHLGNIYIPEGPTPGSDTRPLVQGTLLGVDADIRQALVAVSGGEGTWLPTLMDEDYTEIIGRLVWVVRDPITGRGMLCLGSAGPAPALEEEEEEDIPPPVTGRVDSISGSTITVTAGGETFECRTITSAVVSTGDTVLLYWPTPDLAWVLGKVGAATIPAPSIPGAPSLSRASGVVTVSWSRPSRASSVQIRRSSNGGKTWKTSTGHTGTSTKLSISQGQTLTVQVRAVGAGGTSSWSGSSSTTYPKPTSQPPKTVTKTITITPTWSGTYRNAGGWDRWNTNRYGGRSTLYQGNGYGSGPVEGLATYGNQLKNLNATSITKVEVTVVGAGLSLPSYPSVTLQGSPHGSKPGGSPSSSGSTASASPGKSGTSKTTLPSSVREAMRTGAVKGLALTGGGYTAVRGTNKAGAMALRVTYTVEQ